MKPSRKLVLSYFAEFQKEYPELLHYRLWDYDNNIQKLYESADKEELEEVKEILASFGIKNDTANYWFMVWLIGLVTIEGLEEQSYYFEDQLNYTLLIEELKKRKDNLSNYNLTIKCNSQDFL